MPRSKLIILSLFVLLIGGLLALPAAAQEDAASPSFIANPDLPALEFPTTVDWLNVPGPLTFDDLQGKVVLLDFWTYGCINCIHMIPVLKELEAKYADELVVVGVHSAKFANEGQTDNIRQIVQRYELEHPVVNDNNFEVWGAYRQYGVSAWPTFVLIDPRGNVFASQPGEVPFEAFDRVISGMVAEFDALGEINREAIEITLESAGVPNRALAFPGKVLADDASGRLFIADSNHHRIIVSDLDSYEVLDVIGIGNAGLRDGPFESAAFDKPQGMFLDDQTLYVADTENHAIRAVDLQARTVETIAGTGEQVYHNQPGPALQTPLNSPWDVELGVLEMPDPDNPGATQERELLFIAMAGPHQLWAIDLEQGFIGSVVGSGREGLLDGSFAESQLAQPSGLFYQDGLLYFADSESSSIRVADVFNREVRTVAGPTVNNLFEFGDIDGPVGDSRLQHALGVEGGPAGQIFVADTYNSKIKLIDPATNTIATFSGLGGLGGFRDGALDEAQFDEPGGLSYADGRLFVADTNNHAIRVIDLETNQVSTLSFPNPEALLIDGGFAIVGGNTALGVALELPEQTLAPGDAEIVLQIEIPAGFRLNEIAPFSSHWTSGGAALHIAEENAAQSIIAPEIPLRVPVTLSEGSDVLSADLTIYYCEYDQQSLCFIDELSVTAPVVVSQDATASEILIERSLPLPNTGGVGGL